MQSVQDIKKSFLGTSVTVLTAFIELHKLDERKSVQAIVAQAQRKLDAHVAECTRVQELYDFEREIAKNQLAVGVDEVGRGCIAGPLTVCALTLPAEPVVLGLNDSKQIPSLKRVEIAENIKASGAQFQIVHIQPEDIDEQSMSWALKTAFAQAVQAMEYKPQAILIDGNPLRIDDREISIVKGDTKVASIAGASILAKVERDRIMSEYDELYPQYDFKNNKGYASQRHIEAIKKHGLSPIHRKSFCKNFVVQLSIFDLQ